MKPALRETLVLSLLEERRLREGGTLLSVIVPSARCIGFFCLHLGLNDACKAHGELCVMTA